MHWRLERLDYESSARLTTGEELSPSYGFSDRLTEWTLSGYLPAPITLLLHRLPKSAKAMKRQPKALMIHLFTTPSRP